jgi:hypothetical protein
MRNSQSTYERPLKESKFKELFHRHLLSRITTVLYFYAVYTMNVQPSLALKTWLHNLQQEGLCRYMDSTNEHPWRTFYHMVSLQWPMPAVTFEPTEWQCLSAAAWPDVTSVQLKHWVRIFVLHVFCGARVRRCFVTGRSLGSRSPTNCT